MKPPSTRSLAHLHRVRLLLVLFLSATTIMISSDTTTTESFVTRDGSHLVLAGERFMFTGVNVWNANGRLPNSVYTCGTPTDLDAIAPDLGTGVRVVRAWFFQRLATTPSGRRDWATFDQTLTTAKRHGLRVIATLGNQYGDCEGYESRDAGYKTERWYQDGYRTALPPGQPSTYRQWVQEVVSRYRDDPTIMLWQMMNEAEGRSSPDGSCGIDAANRMYDFVRDVGNVIKSIDRRHLLGIGTMGSGQCGTSGLEYVALHAISTIDVTEYHDYSLEAMPGDRWNGLAVRLRQAADLGKPLLVGEIGISTTQVGSRRSRALLVRDKLEAQFNAGVVGALLWAWGNGAADGAGAGGYDIGPGDPVLEQLADVSRGL